MSRGFTAADSFVMRGTPITAGDVHRLSEMLPNLLQISGQLRVMQGLGATAGASLAVEFGNFKIGC